MYKKLSLAVAISAAMVMQGCDMGKKEGDKSESQTDSSTHESTHAPTTSTTNSTSRTGGTVEQVKATGSVSGVVFGSDGQIIPKAVVSAQGKQVIADDSGNFLIEDLKVSATSVNNRMVSAPITVTILPPASKSKTPEYLGLTATTVLTSVVHDSAGDTTNPNTLIQDGFNSDIGRVELLKLDVAIEGTVNQQGDGLSQGPAANMMLTFSVDGRRFNNFSGSTRGVDRDNFHVVPTDRTRENMGINTVFEYLPYQQIVKTDASGRFEAPALPAWDNIRVVPSRGGIREITVTGADNVFTLSVAAAATPATAGTPAVRGGVARLNLVGFQGQSIRLNNLLVDIDQARDVAPPFITEVVDARAIVQDGVQGNLLQLGSTNPDRISLRFSELMHHFNFDRDAIRLEALAANGTRIPVGITSATWKLHELDAGVSVSQLDIALDGAVRAQLGRQFDQGQAIELELFLSSSAGLADMAGNQIATAEPADWLRNLNTEVAAQGALTTATPTGQRLGNAAAYTGLGTDAATRATASVARIENARTELLAVADLPVVVFDAINQFTFDAPTNVTEHNTALDGLFGSFETALLTVTANGGLRQVARINNTGARVNQGVSLQLLTAGARQTRFGSLRLEQQFKDDELTAANGLALAAVFDAEALADISPVAGIQNLNDSRADLDAHIERTIQSVRVGTGDDINNHSARIRVPFDRGVENYVIHVRRPAAGMANQLDFTRGTDATNRNDERIDVLLVDGDQTRMNGISYNDVDLINLPIRNVGTERITAAVANTAENLATPNFNVANANAAVINVGTAGLNNLEGRTHFDILLTNVNVNDQVHITPLDGTNRTGLRPGWLTLEDRVAPMVLRQDAYGFGGENQGLAAIGRDAATGPSGINRGELVVDNVGDPGAPNGLALPLQPRHFGRPLNAVLMQAVTGARADSDFETLAALPANANLKTSLKQFSLHDLTVASPELNINRASALYNKAVATFNRGGVLQTDAVPAVVRNNLYTAAGYAAWSNADSLPIAIQFSENIQLAGANRPQLQTRDRDTVAGGPELVWRVAEVSSAVDDNGNRVGNFANANNREGLTFSGSYRNLLNLANAQHGNWFSFANAITDAHGNSAGSARLMVRDLMPPMVTRAVITGNVTDGFTLRVEFNEPVLFAANPQTPAWVTPFVANTHQSINVGGIAVNNFLTQANAATGQDVTAASLNGQFSSSVFEGPITTTGTALVEGAADDNDRVVTTDAGRQFYRMIFSNVRDVHGNSWGAYQAARGNIDAATGARGYFIAPNFVVEGPQ